MATEEITEGEWASRVTEAAEKHDLDPSLLLRAHQLACDVINCQADLILATQLMIQVEMLVLGPPKESK